MAADFDRLRGMHLAARCTDGRAATAADGNGGGAVRRHRRGAPWRLAPHRRPAPSRATRALREHFEASMVVTARLHDAGPLDAQRSTSQYLERTPDLMSASTPAPRVRATGPRTCTNCASSAPPVLPQRAGGSSNRIHTTHQQPQRSPQHLCFSYDFDNMAPEMPP